MCSVHKSNCCHVRILEDKLKQEDGSVVCLDIQDCLREGAPYPDVVKEATSTEAILFDIPATERVNFV